MEEIEEKYWEIANKKVKDDWYNWTEAEKKAREMKAVYEASLRTLEGAQYLLNKKKGLA